MSDFNSALEQLAKETIPLNRYALSNDMSLTLNKIKAFVTHFFPQAETKVHRYASGSKFNYWKIGHQWHVKAASIKTVDGELLMDLGQHPLHVMLYSKPVSRTLSKKELERHTYFKPELPDAIPYIYRQQYRHWQDAWGIAMSQHQWERLPDSDMQIHIETEESFGHLEVLECIITGNSEQSILFCPHVCHPSQANDGISGAVLSLYALHQLLSAFDAPLGFTYRLLFTTEIIGPAAFLHFNSQLKDSIVQTICPSWCGLASPIAYSRCRMPAKLDRIFEYVLQHSATAFQIYPYMQHPVGDETIFDSPGLEIPTSCVQRIHPDHEYHSSWDNLNHLSFESIYKLGQLCAEALKINERDWVPQRTFSGLPCLSNPELDLYLDFPTINGIDNPAYVDRGAPSDWRNIDFYSFMTLFMHDLNGSNSLFDIAFKYGVPFEFLYDYLNLFKAKRLVS